MATSYEDLGPERFQELCQALLVKQYPRLQCFPVGMPDGGRDASIPRRTEDVIVFQVKFRRRTPLAEATYPEYLKWLQDAIKSDLSSVDRLLKKGLKRYIVISNVPGSSHSENGTMEQMRRWLEQTLPAKVDFDVWWRADIDRRLEGEWDIRRSYGLTDSPQSSDALLSAMIAGQQVSSNVVSNIAGVNLRKTAIRKFLRTQYERDANIRFREADLPPQPLIQSYLDIHADINSLVFNHERPPSEASHMVRSYAAEKGRLQISRRKENPLTAAQLFLQYGGTPELRNAIIEGAPGQGKSTLTQYLCQVHRARLLGKDEALKPVKPIYRTSPILLPFRTDLRDLATWLQGENPFGAMARVEGYPRSIEGFLAAMVSVSAGGATFTVDDLDDTILAAPTLLVFDGLDEVAELEARQDIVKQVSECSYRLHEISPELQIIVTSRPTAFSGAPQFSRDQFSYVTLSNLTRELIFDYTKTWTKARKVEADDAKELTDTLNDKLREPHIQELAQNSMQLAILLWLMHQQTGSLPDQRTRLYEQYLNTFLNREANKSEILRRHREPILQLHGYLAWILHARAEQGRSQGNIAEDELKELLRGYLGAEGYSQVAIVDELFQGMVERVVALVSRVQGTYEFEVQPLREYFAAYYLYKTARYSPPGLPVTGTKADRFDAIARNPYWQNVTRFYVGFFDKGELSYLFTQFSNMFEDGPYSKLQYPRTLASIVITDQVFGQSPGVGSKLAARICQDAIGWYALADRSDGARMLPIDSGGKEVMRQGMALLEKGPLSYASKIVQTLSPLGDRYELAAWWKSKLPPRESEGWSRWMSLGVGLNVLEILSPQEAVSIVDPTRCEILDIEYLLKGGFGHLGYDDAAVGARFLEYLKTGLMTAARYNPRDIFELVILISVDTHGSLYRIVDLAPPILKQATPIRHLSPIVQFITELMRESRVRQHFGRRYLGEQIQRFLGRCWLSDKLRLVPDYYGTSVDAEAATVDNIVQESCSYDTKIRSAVLKSDDTDWWQQNISDASSAADELMISAMLLMYGSDRAVAMVLPSISPIVSRWRPEQTLGVLDALSNYRARSTRLSTAKLNLAAIQTPELLAAIGFCARLDQKAAALDSSAEKLTDVRVKEYVIDELINVCSYRLIRTKRWAGGRFLSEKYASLSSVERGVYIGPSSRPDSGIDGKVAREILAAPEKYPPAHVMLAERTISREVASGARPVADIAVEDNWFDQPQPF